MLSKFKHAQMLLLDEVMNEDRYKFNCTSRELLLQIFSIWSDWLVSVEKSFICGERIVSSSQIDQLYKDLDGVLNQFYTHAISDSDYYDPEYVRIWLRTFPKEIESYKHVLDSLDGAGHMTAFAKITETSVQFMNHHLFILQEVDSALCEKRSSFLAIDRFDINLKADFNTSNVLHRFKVYVEEGIMREACIKNYIGELEDQSPVTKMIFENTISELRKLTEVTSIV